MSEGGDDITRMSEDDMEASVATSVENTRADEAPSLPTIVPPPAGPGGVSSAPNSTTPKAGAGGAPRASMNRGKEPLDLGPWQRCERKDAAGIVLVSPYLKGQLVRDERGDHIFKGRWSISFEQFEPGPGPMSDFDLRHKSADPHEADTFPYGGSYSGWFKLAVGPNKETKLEEKDVYIFFNRHRERNGYNVSGKGHNNYGPFQIYGRATKTSESSMDVELFREYGPPEPKPEGAARAPRPSGEARPRDRKSGGGASAALIRKPAGGSPGGDLLVGAAARAQQKRLAVQMKSMSDKSSKRCFSVLKELREKHHYACGWFESPVDPAQAPDYHTIIKTPMCFKWIQDKLTSRPCKYSAPQDFAADMRLVFQNAMTYNAPETPYFTDAETLKEAFNESYKRACADLKIGFDDGSGKTPSMTIKAAPKKKQPDNVGPRAPPAPQYTQLAAGTSDADMYSNPLVTSYKRQMEELADQLARVESENMKLKRRNRELEERVEELESAMGASGRGGASSYAPPAPAAERSAAGTPTNRNAHTQGRHSPAPAPAGPAVSAEERAKLEGYIRELVNTGDATIITDLASVLEQNGVGSADGELTIDVHEFDDATCRALIDFCEPYFEHPEDPPAELEPEPEPEEDETSDLFLQARQMKQAEMEREKEREEEEARRRAQQEEEDRRRQELLMEQKRRLEKERQEEEERARKAREEEEERKRKAIADERERARMERQRMA